METLDNITERIAAYATEQTELVNAPLRAEILELRRSLDRANTDAIGHRVLVDALQAHITELENHPPAN